MLTAAAEAMSRGVPAKAWLAIVLAIASGSSFVLSPRLGSASPNSVLVMSVGIDADPGSTPANTATTLGTIESCRLVNNGDTFTVDFYVMNVPGPGIEGFSGDLLYTSTKLKVVQTVTGPTNPMGLPITDVNELLGANAGSSVSDFTNYSAGIDQLPDMDGTFTPGAVDFGSASGHSETGSGVLARVTLQAIANGAAALTLTNVKLADPSFNPIGDTNGDGVFDGAISNAGVGIGQACPDADGFLDIPATLHEGPSNTNTAVDNCVGTYNPAQLNADGNFIDLTPPKSNDDKTWINSDALGDACDTDDDNDGLLDTAEPTGCNGSGPLNPLLRDHDLDRFIDSVECTLGTNPANAANKPVLASCGATGDSDADGVATRVEYCYYGSSNSSTNTDGDTCTDGKELANVDPNTTVGAQDLGLVASAFGSYTAPPASGTAWKMNMDIDKNGTVNAADLGLVAAKFGACP